MIELLYFNNKNKFQDEEFDRILFLLPEQERVKILKYKQWKDRQARAIGRFLVMDLLRRKNISGKKIENLSYTEYGKPFFEGVDFNFNISHSGDYVVCAYGTNVKVGVDIEEMKDINFEDFDSILTSEEKYSLYISKNKKALFYKIWCTKEAALKADGRGLSVPLNQINLIQEKVTINNVIYHTQKININPAYELIVASSNKDYDVSVHEFNLQNYLD